MDDGGNGIEEMQPVLPGRLRDAFCQRAAGERAGGDDGGAIAGQGINQFAHDLDIGMIFQRPLHAGGEHLAIDREG